MASNDNPVQDFVTLIEQIHSVEREWCLDGKQRIRAQELSACILEDAIAANEVPIGIWVAFLGLQPYEDALMTLADLSEVSKTILTKILTIDGDNDLLTSSRDLSIQRLNIAVRKKLHADLLPPDRQARITRVLKAMKAHR